MCIRDRSAHVLKLTLIQKVSHIRKCRSEICASASYERKLVDVYKRQMIGRGLFANPALIAELKGISMDKAELRERLKNLSLIHI